MRIMTERKWEDRSFYQVAWEWEDAIKETFENQGFPVEFDYVHATKNKALQYLYKFIITKNQLPIKKTNIEKIEVYFPLRVWHCNQYLKKNMIPIFLDAYESDTDVIIRMTRKLPFFFVTAYDTYKEIKRKDPSSKVQFMPLSISDRWVDEEVYEKDIDVIQMGRRSETLHQYMIKYCENHPNVNYVYLESKKTWNYTSTTLGSMGTLDTRDEFMNMLRRARVSLVSTPGIETQRFGSFDFFTPRFFESSAAGCMMIGRYTENEESDLLDVNSVCSNVKSQKEFDDILDNMLEVGLTEERIQAIKTFTDRNVTSKRAIQILETIKSAR